MKNTYLLLDSGNQKKLEQFGEYILIRPCSQALWSPKRTETEWRSMAHATFSREEGWHKHKPLPTTWTMDHQGVRFQISPTDFGHLGIFPEHAALWGWAADYIKTYTNPIEVLNLFAYSGGASIAMAQAGARVCHVDASQGMVAWARDNARLNGVEKAPIRWIIDDVHKFLKREIKRGKRYEGIILDPPSFGRGAKGEVFKLERDLPGLLELCAALLSENPLFLLVSAHTPGVSPLTLSHLVREHMPQGHMDHGELILPGTIPIPCGVYASWHHK